MLRAIAAGLFALGWISASGMSPAAAQMAMPGGGRSLGGYGASTITSYYGGGGGGYVPYNGRAGGYVPYRGGVGGGLGVQPVSRRPPLTPVGGTMMARTPIGGASLSGGLGMGSGLGARGLVPFGYEGGVGTDGMAGMPKTRRGGIRRSTAPGFGYPFRIPPDFAGGGASMSMP